MAFGVHLLQKTKFWSYHRSWSLCNYCVFNWFGSFCNCQVIQFTGKTLVSNYLSHKKLFQEATNLKGRPPLHCSTFPLILCIFLLLMSHIFQNNLVLNSSLILLTAFISHHTRDATRRGYWLYPFGSTPPLPYSVYVLVTCTIPYIIFRIHEGVKISNSKYLDTSIV